jgi:hypothetical protein
VGAAFSHNKKSDNQASFRRLWSGPTAPCREVGLSLVAGKSRETTQIARATAAPIGAVGLADWRAQTPQLWLDPMTDSVATAPAPRLAADSFVVSLLGRMSLAEKVGQMVQVPYTDELWASGELAR